MPAESGSSVLTIDELAEYLRISKSTLYKLALEGSIPCQKVGKHWRFHKVTVDEWLRQRGPAALPPKSDSERSPYPFIPFQTTAINRIKKTSGTVGPRCVRWT
jgi:excisionase family DNA binding protein